jgi:hypothetical protein
VKGCIPKLFLVRDIMKMVENTVEDVKFIAATMVWSVFIAIWHYERHQLIRGIKKPVCRSNDEGHNNTLN